MRPVIRLLMGIAILAIAVPAVIMTTSENGPGPSAPMPAAADSSDDSERENSLPTLGEHHTKLTQAKEDIPDSAGVDEVGDPPESSSTTAQGSEESLPTTSEAGSPTTTESSTTTTGSSDDTGRGKTDETITGNVCPCTVTGTATLKGKVRLRGDLMVVGGTLIARPGVDVEGNGFQIMFMEGANADFEGSSASAWSGDGRSANLSRDVNFRNLRRIMFHEGAGASKVRFIAVHNSGTPALGDYPLHWHLNGDSTRGTIVEGVVVVGGKHHAFVPHGSHGITFKDTIAKNTAGDAYWYDPGDETNDLVYDHVLADGVTIGPNQNRDFRLTAFWLGRGQGNTIRDSVALNVNPSFRKDCSGFHWPEKNGGPGPWVFENNASFGSECHGIFWWHNNPSGDKVIDGFRGDGIKHGAYVNATTYRNVDVAEVVFTALSWRMENSVVRGDVEATWHVVEGEPVVFSNVEIGGRFIITDANQNRTTPGVYMFEDTNLTCGEVVWENALAESTVTINGITCSQ